MSLGEKLYLVMVTVMFVSFGLLLATLTWLDGKEARAARSLDRKAAPAPSPRRSAAHAMGHSAATSH